MEALHQAETFEMAGWRVLRSRQILTVSSVLLHLHGYPWRTIQVQCPAQGSRQ